MRRAVIALLLLIAAPGCSAVTAGTETPPPATITIYPANGATAARTNHGLIVKAHGSPLSRVTVFAGGQAVPGTFDPAHTIWRSAWTLRPDMEYAVSATAARVRADARFRTLRPQHTVDVATATPDTGETVGVGMPIIVTFTGPVTDHRAVERALEITSSKPVEGAWHWFSDTEVVYRPRKVWPAHITATFTAHLSGVRTAPGTFGTRDLTIPFAIGRRMISTVDTVTHQMAVRRDGELVQRMAISAGMATTKEYTTTSGIHLTMEKGNPVRMISPGKKKNDPDYYDVMIGYAVRISNSGEYVHAKNNVWAQGQANVSHGCVNARPDQAQWFYDNALRGDPVIITGTDRPLEWDNGWGFWQIPWDQWLRGSALARGVVE
ncbi:L,D-transpeptidase family protein [Streptosporangiaceae bacterium NEAU-GS5]|nr:L,D-transpeptidase family protein [Streptosporangiaceae bacterium NEAU-GS5]